LSEEYALRKSIRLGKCIDKEGNETPWYTFPAIEYLKSLDFSKCRVLEFGSGASSIWWANRSKSVMAIEHSKDWFDKISTTAKENLTTVLAESELEYLSAFAGKTFDVIVIDGVHRHRCAEIVSDALTSNGLVILDNSDWHPEAARILRERSNLLQVDFHGFGPINGYTWTTSLFFSRGFVCTPLTDRLPSYSAGAIRQLANGQQTSEIEL
jgi:hypothetical protein